MSNLFNLGRSGLNAAQMGLNATGHNIANVNTAGYNRQQALLSTAGAQGGATGYVGRGVQVDTVRRLYDGFLSGQLNRSTSLGAELSTHAGQLDQINNLLADRTVGIAPALTKFFDGMNAVASAPADPAARQELLGQANSLASQLRTANQFMQTQREQLNQQISTHIASINSYAERISALNQQVVTARATVHSQPPNDLLDQRDQLVAELNELISVTVVEQDHSFSLVVGNGQTLLSGNTVFPLAAVQSAADPSRLALAYTTAGGVAVELPDTALSGGSLGGLLAFRTDSLDNIQNELGRLAVGMALTFNAQHALGADLAGHHDPDMTFFSFQSPVTALVHDRNQGDAVFGFEYVDANALTASDYSIRYDNDAYTITRLADGEEFQPEPDAGVLADFELDGIRFQAPIGAPADGDRFLVQPARNAAGHIGVAITDPARIAAAAPDTGTANGVNALALAQLQTAKTLGQGSMSFTEAYSQLVNRVGVQSSAIQTASKAQDSLIAQNFAAQQAVSGVNLNEEYINLDFYVQQYNASARLIEVGGTLFDTLLGLR